MTFRAIAAEGATYVSTADGQYARLRLSQGGAASVSVGYATGKTESYPLSFGVTSLGMLQEGTTVTVVIYSGTVEIQTNMVRPEDVGSSAAADPYNSPATLRNLRLALMQAASGTGRVKLAIVSDSTAVFPGAGNYPKVWVERLIKAMGARPENAPPGATYPGWQNNSFYGNQNSGGTPATYALYDTRVAFGGGGWVNTRDCDPFGFQFTFTGASFNNAGATLSFTPENPIDSFTVYHGGRSGSYSVNVDGGSALTVASGQSAGLTTVACPSSIASFAAGNSTFTVPAGAHTINIVVQSGSTTDIRGVNAWLSTASYIDVLRLSTSGARTDKLASNINFFDGGRWWFNNYAPAITIIRLTTNELAYYIAGGKQQSYIDSYIANLEVIRTNKGAANQLVMVAGPWYGPAARAIQEGGRLTSDPLLSALVTWCQANSLPFFDMFSHWGFGSDSGATGLIGGDSTHPTAAGHLAEARAWVSRLSTLSV